MSCQTNEIFVENYRESNGKPGKIHVSEETAKLLMAVNKEKWLTQRVDRIQAKGKGELTTYWVDPMASSPGSVADSTSTPVFSDHTSSFGDDDVLLDSKSMRLIDWNVEMLARFLRKIVSRRACTPDLASGPKGSFPTKKDGTRVIDEFIEVLPLIEYGNTEKVNGLNTENELRPAIMKQLREYVTSVCTMYNAKNSFHNFEHASVSFKCMSIASYLLFEPTGLTFTYSFFCPNSTLP